MMMLQFMAALPGKRIMNMKKMTVMLLAVCLLLSGCSETPIVSADSLKGENIVLTEPVRVSFALGTETSTDAPFTLGITKSGIMVKYIEGTEPELIISLYAKDENTDIAEATLSESNPIVRFTSLRSARTYYLRIQKTGSQERNAVLEICQCSS